MVYIKRQEDGEITAVSSIPEPGFEEESDARGGELTAFLSSARNSAELAQSDLSFIRVLDDLLEVLMAKGVIAFTDLPQEAQSKLLERTSLRAKNRESLDLLDDQGLI